MGIPRLFTHLQPYGVSVELGCEQGDRCKRHGATAQTNLRFIVDGPSLAYHVHNRLLAHKPSTLNVLDATLSSKELGEAFLVFLDELQAHGAIIESIFFDGYLPARKFTVRHNRLGKSLRDLSLFHATHITGFEPSPQRLATPRPPYKHQLFKSARKVPLKFHGLPPPAFLIPAVFDALRDSKYAACTTLVPEEADVYCARAARNGGGIILTSDSDMLVYELGNGAVTFLSDVQLIGEEPIGNQMAFCETLKASIWRPDDIAEKLGAVDLLQFAFRISQDPHLTATKAVQSARRVPKNVDDFEEFVKEYEIDSIIHEPLKYCEECPESVMARFQHMDPRVAELCFQMISPDSRTNPTCVYLPFLVEDPSKSTAWAPSLHLRAMAYTYLTRYAINKQHTERICDVEEYTRKGSRFVLERINLGLPDEDMENEAHDLASRILNIHQLLEISLSRSASPASSRINSPQTSSNPRLSPWQWTYRLLAVREIHDWHVTSHKTPPTRAALTRILSGSRASKWTWNDVHLSAQIKGLLYSLRMLGQILRYVYSGNETTMLRGTRALYEVCEALPGLTELMLSINGEEGGTGEVLDNQDTVDDLLRMVQLGSKSTEWVSVGAAEGGGKGKAEESREGKRRRGKKGKPPTSTKPRGAGSSNMYDMLADGGME